MNWEVPGFQIFSWIEQLDRTVYISVMTLIMQSLCDAITKGGKVQINHWGRIPLSPCVSMHAYCCASELKMKAGIHVLQANLDLNSSDSGLLHVQPMQ